MLGQTQIPPGEKITKNLTSKQSWKIEIENRKTEISETWVKQIKKEKSVRKLNWEKNYFQKKKRRPDGKEYFFKTNPIPGSSQNKKKTKILYSNF